MEHEVGKVPCGTYAHLFAKHDIMFIRPLDRGSKHACKQDIYVMMSYCYEN